MKKKYIKPEIIVISTQTESLLASASGSGTDSNNKYTFGEDGEGGNQQSGNIGTAGDGDEFIMESKGNSLWEEEWD